MPRCAPRELTACGLHLDELTGELADSADREAIACSTGGGVRQAPTWSVVDRFGDVLEPALQELVAWRRAGRRGAENEGEIER